MKKTTLMFPGQGSQKIGMGKEIYNSYTIAKEVFQETDDSLNQHLSKLIFEGDINELTKTENTQPALMAVSLAVFKVIEQQTKLKINDFANFVCGHSLGEYSALACSNAISLSDCAKILRIRGNAMQKAGSSSNGAMAAIIGTDIETTELIAKESAESDICEIANDNSIGQIVISGDESAIDRSLEIAKKHGAKRAIKLPVSGAFHSSLISSAKIDLENGLDNIEILKPAVSLIANVTASEVNEPSLIKKLLIDQVTSMVRWRETLEYLAQKQEFEIAEIGSGNVLCGLARRTNKEFNSISVETPEQIEKFIETNIIN